MQNRRRQLTAAAVCIALSVVFLMLFSTTTSWLFHGQKLTDSAIFMTVGRGWTEGMLPYRDLFDTKGLFLYAINALGFLISSSRTGVFLLQVVSLSIALYFAFLMFKRHFSFAASLGLTALTCFALSFSMEGGNSAEEYILPFLFACFYLLLKWFDKGCGRHPLAWSGVYGMTLAVALLTRLTNALPLCGALLVVIALFIRQRRWGELGANALAFIVGFLLFCLPFAVYLAVTGTFSDFIYGCLTFNFRYLYLSDSGIHTLPEIARWLKSFVWCWLPLLFFLTLLPVRGSRSRMLTWAMSALLPLLWFIFGQGYGHYAIICLPVFPLMLIEARRLLRSHASRMMRLFLPAVILLVACGTVYEVRSSYQISREQEPDLDAYRLMMRYIPHYQLRSIIAYGDMPDFYYYAHVLPCYPFFSIQEMACERDPVIAERIRLVFATGHARWLVVKGAAPHIADIVKRRYRPVMIIEENGITLYQLRDGQ